VTQRLATLAVPFIENAGQVDSRVAYYASTLGGTVFVTHDGDIVCGLAGKGTVTERFVGGHARPAASNPAGTRVSIFQGNDPARWRSDVPTYATVSLGDVYPGITVELQAHGEQIEHVFTVAPKASVRRIQVRATHAKALKVTAEGTLAVQTMGGDVHLTRPVAYQMIDGKRRNVEVAYTVLGDVYGFRVGRYDTRSPLIIDPLLQATYLGGAGLDYAVSIALNPSTGEVYVGGATGSADFPITAGAAQTTFYGGGGSNGYAGDAFVARLNPTLTAFDSATYLGGSGIDELGSITLNPTTGEVYVSGWTTSSDFPGTTNGAQPTFGGNSDAFVARLNSALSMLDQATYLGGSGGEYSGPIALNPTTGEVYVAGETSSSSADFPGTANGAEPTPYYSEAGFVARLNPSLTVLDQATYFGAFRGGGIADIALNPTTGEVYIAGSTSNLFGGLPENTTGGAQPTFGGFVDAFVARLNPALTMVDQTTYLGGTGGDYAVRIAIHPGTGDVFVTGGTTSPDFPGTAGGAQPALQGGDDAFLASLNSTLMVLNQATYLGGSVNSPRGGHESGNAIALNAATGEVYVTGGTNATDFPGTAGGIQPTALTSTSGGEDGFVARLNTALTVLNQATYLGGSGGNEAAAIAVHPTTGEVYVSGLTASSDFPGTAGGAQASYGGGDDGFVARLSADLKGNGCGDGNPNEPGKQCDDGPNNGPTSACLPVTCQWNTCGDGHVCSDPNTCGVEGPTQLEQCDDGAKNGGPDSCCTNSCTLQPQYTPCTGGTCKGDADTCVLPSCTGSSSEGWAYTAAITPGEGLVVTDLRFGPRLFARRISLPYFAVQRTGQQAPEYGRLSPTPSGAVASKLVSFHCLNPISDGTGDVGAEAIYRVTPTEGYNILVDQTYRFARFDPTDKHCESTKTVPCARFWPTVTWALDDTTPTRPGFNGFEAIQRFEFDPDGLGSGTADLFADSISFHLNPLNPAGIGVRTLGSSGWLKKEDSRLVIQNGGRHDWDSWHQSTRDHTSSPGSDPFKKTPGCSDCLHAHWTWGLDANCGCNGVPPGCRDVHCWTDGQPEILPGSGQSADVGWVKFAPGEVDPWPAIQNCPATGLPPDASVSESKLRALWQCLIDARIGNKKASKISKSDRLVVYWDGFTSAANAGNTVVNIGGTSYTAGDAYWPRLLQIDGVTLDRTHGDSGEMFALPARVLVGPGTTSQTWTVQPQWNAVTSEPSNLDARLPSGYVLPVKITRASTSALPFPDRGPFYLRVHGDCSGFTSIVNPDPLYTENQVGPPWVKIYQDQYSPSSSGGSGTFTPGPVVTEVPQSGATLMAYLVFFDPPDQTKLSFDLVAAPNGSDGYVPLADTSTAQCSP
jgi:hypothetical protein